MQSSTHADPNIVAFYTSLTPKDRLIHELAATMLGTRYDPKRSNAYLAFKKGDGAKK
jgi:hypothetical protein